MVPDSAQMCWKVLKCAERCPNAFSLFYDIAHFWVH